jgi:hypothetical protein
MYNCISLFKLFLPHRRLITIKVAFLFRKWLLSIVISQPRLSFADILVVAAAATILLKLAFRTYMKHQRLSAPHHGGRHALPFVPRIAVVLK